MLLYFSAPENAAHALYRGFGFVRESELDNSPKPMSPLGVPLSLTRSAVTKVSPTNEKRQCDLLLDTFGENTRCASVLQQIVSSELDLLCAAIPTRGTRSDQAVRCTRRRSPNTTHSGPSLISSTAVRPNAAAYSSHEAAPECVLHRRARTSPHRC